MNLKTHIRENLWLDISNSYEAENCSHAIADAMHHLTDIIRESGLTLLYCEAKRFTIDGGRYAKACQNEPECTSHVGASQYRLDRTASGVIGPRGSPLIWTCSKSLTLS